MDMDMISMMIWNSRSMVQRIVRQEVAV